MRKVEIISIGKNKEAWLQEALAEYEKRLSKVVQIEWTFLRTLDKISPPFIALDPAGELVSSEALSRKLIHLFDAHDSRLRFIIGGAEGLPPDLCKKSLWKWSLSPLTFTHQMTRLLLLEQLYRSFSIDAGSHYHK